MTLALQWTNCVNLRQHREARYYLVPGHVLRRAIDTSAFDQVNVTDNAAPSTYRHGNSRRGDRRSAGPACLHGWRGCCGGQTIKGVIDYPYNESVHVGRDRCEIDRRVSPFHTDQHALAINPRIRLSSSRVVTAAHIELRLLRDPRAGLRVPDIQFSDSLPDSRADTKASSNSRGSAEPTTSRAVPGPGQHIRSVRRNESADPKTISGG